jgi:hypothetical protein
MHGNGAFPDKPPKPLLYLPIEILLHRNNGYQPKLRVTSYS